MELNIQSPVLCLQAGQVLTLDDAVGTRIRARTGTVWVTQEGRTADDILGAGGELVVTNGGRTVVQALQPAWIYIR